MNIKKLYGFLFFIILFMPFVQGVMGIFPVTKLNGVETEIKKSSFSAISWFNGQYARDFESYFAANIGFRSVVIKIINQIKYELFRDVSRDKGTEIIIGSDDWLFEKVYADRLIFDHAMPETQLIMFSELMSQVQIKLAEKGVAFLLIISPSKAEIYKEKLPESILARLPNKNMPTNRERLITYLKKKEVHYLDAHDLFLKLKSNSDILFTPGGTHWNYYGSFLVCSELIKILNNNTAITLPIPVIESIQHRSALGTDKDLADLLNLIWYRPNKSPIPYPTVNVDALPTDKRLNVLVVGDSFAITLIDSMGISQMARHIDFMYYNSRLFSYSPIKTQSIIRNMSQTEIGPIEHAAFDWDKILANKKLVVLEINEIQLNRLAWGWLNLLNKHLTGAQELGDDGIVQRYSQDLVAEIYIATFNRAPDYSGLKYWANAVAVGQLTSEQVAKSFFDQPETRAIFPEGTNNTAFITTIFQNAFNRAPTAAGIAYWVSALDRGEFSRDQAIIQILNGAKAETGNPADAAMLAKKTEFGVFFANSAIGNMTNNVSFIDWTKDIIKLAANNEFTIEKAKDYIKGL